MFKEMCASISNEDQLNFINKIAVHLKNNKLPISIIYYGSIKENIDMIRNLNLNQKKINLRYTFFETGKYEVNYFFSDF